MRPDMSMLQGSCQWAFQGCSCSLAVIDVRADANAAGLWIIFCLSVCVIEKERETMCGCVGVCVCVCACVCVYVFAVVLMCVAGPAGRKCPAREAFGVRLLMQKCQHHWKWSWGKCVNGLVWELPLCQKQLVRMRSRDRGLINYLHILDWRSC